LELEHLKIETRFIISFTEETFPAKKKNEIRDGARIPHHEITGAQLNTEDRTGKEVNSCNGVV
jgi:hypothetical protein